MYWRVTSIVERSSKLMPNATTYHIELENIQTRERRITYIEDRFKNYANWQEVIKNYPRGQILSNIITFDKNKVDADSNPQIEFVLDSQQMQQMLEEQWQRIQVTKR